jgi:hypothetical protein
LSSPATAGFSALGKVPDAGAPRDDGVGRLVRNGATSGGWGTAATEAFPTGGAPTSSGAVAVAVGAAATASWRAHGDDVRISEASENRGGAQRTKAGAKKKFGPAQRTHRRRFSTCTVVFVGSPSDGG